MMWDADPGQVPPPGKGTLDKEIEDDTGTAGRNLSPIPTWAAGAGPDAAGTPPGRPRPRPPLAFPPSPLRFHH